MAREIESILLDRLYKTASAYFILKETGDTQDKTPATIRKELLRALLDVRLPRPGEWHSAGEIHFTF